jgi:uncharacterized protein (DUF433 family)
MTNHASNTPKTVQKSLRLPQDVARRIEEIADESRRDFSSVTNEMLSEAVRMRRCPGIVFADGPTGRHARIAGTGIAVWELVRTYRAVGDDRDRLGKAYHWLSNDQVRAALGYYAAHPDEIDRRIERDDAWTAERLAREHPTITPGRAPQQ